MYLTNGKDYFAVHDETAIAKLKANGYREITLTELSVIKARALINYVQQSDPKNAKPISG